MRRGILMLLVVLASGVILIQVADAGRPRAHTARSSVRLKLRLPGADSARVLRFTLTVTPTGGRPASVSVRGLNEARLPSGIRAMGIVTPRSSRRRHKFTLYLGINNLTPRPTGNAHTSQVPDLEIVITIDGKSDLIYTRDLQDFKPPVRCQALVHSGNLADRAPAAVTIVKLSEGQSDGEEILDHLAYDRYHCPGAEKMPETEPI